MKEVNNMYECLDCQNKNINKDDVRDINHEGGGTMGGEFSGICPQCGKRSFFRRYTNIGVLNLI
jgi:predicted nucleic-acid-binding Zn-ribbon protein